MTMTSRSLDVSDWPVVALSYVMLSCNLICLDLWVFPLRAPCVGDVAREINSTPPILAGPGRISIEKLPAGSLWKNRFDNSVCV